MTETRAREVVMGSFALAPLSPALPIRLALGFVYVGFGALKLFPDLSSAELIAEQTILQLGLGLSATGALWSLALIECAIGLSFLSWWAPKTTVALFYAHMAGTFLSLLLLPELTFTVAPLAPNLEGQYILKNLVFIATGPALLADTRAGGAP